jgi:hypothetical protein
LDSASSFSAALSPVPIEIPRLVLEGIAPVWKARPVNIALQELVMKNRRIRFDEVRSEGKMLMSMVRGWRMLQSEK